MQIFLDKKKFQVTDQLQHKDIEDQKYPDLLPGKVLAMAVNARISLSDVTRSLRYSIFSIKVLFRIQRKTK